MQTTSHGSETNAHLKTSKHSKEVQKGLLARVRSGKFILSKHFGHIRQTCPPALTLHLPDGTLATSFEKVTENFADRLHSTFDYSSAIGRPTPPPTAVELNLDSTHMSVLG
ncbi:hypothetical protein FGIG_02990 [Fasciola gigantica]|uniref:Uncharacterized protein n=1 Tax=Fasciola gigantica TaxID=46835 RepID=A0A504YAZ0_FASGI|nr:hypothetical protein FGIG_02990 [Fasciola gigantica]